MTEPADQTETLAGAGGGPAPPRSSGPVVLGGRYALTERIASGGMASVWRARDEVLTRTVAVKVLHDHLAADDAFRERFRREAIAAAKLTHPNVVSLYDTGSDGDKVYLVMEFVEGATLKDVIAERSTLASGQAASIGEKVARALDYAHERGLVHRDVKPANILIGDDGAVKVADFGIAKAEEAEADLTKTGMVLGTAAYVAPEQITGATQIDGRADQYALGCMLYEALTGRQPFKGDSAVATAAQRLETTPLPLRSVKPDVPRGLDAVVMRSLSRKPEQRYDTTGQLANALAAFSDADTAQTAALASSAEGATNAWSRPVTESGTASWGLRPPPRAGRHAAAATSQVSRRHGENRWVWAVIALILAGGALAGYGLATGGMGIPTGQQDQAGDGSGQGGQGQVAEAAAIEIADGSSFDPEGDGSENEESVANLYDGDPSTTWRTDTYSTADFGNLKQGVGFWLDLGGRQRIASVQLETVTPGVSYEVYVADEPAETLDGWEKIGEAGDAQPSSAVTLDAPAEGAYVLVWVVRPLPGPNRAEFGGVTVSGEPA